MATDILKKVSVLIVEDDEESIEPLKFILNKYTCKIFIERNGKDGLERYKEHQPDIVLTDIQMPIKSGIDMAEEIREINPHAQIIYITAHSEIDLILKAIDAGADGFIVKPINMDKLLARLIKSTKVILSDRCMAEDKDFFSKYMSCTI
jgi:YesN/AraC family two-component response regulator